MDSSLQEFYENPDTTHINQLLLSTSKLSRQNPDSALVILTHLENLPDITQYNYELAKAYFLHGNILYKINVYSEALGLFKKALDKSTLNDYQLLLGRCLERMASIHLTMGNSNLSLKLYYESLVIFERLNDIKGIAKVYNIFGVYKAESGDFELAEDYL